MNHRWTGSAWPEGWTLGGYYPEDCYTDKEKENAILEIVPTSKKTKKSKKSSSSSHHHHKKTSQEQNQELKNIHKDLKVVYKNFKMIPQRIKEAHQGFMKLAENINKIDEDFNKTHRELSNIRQRLKKVTKSQGTSTKGKLPVPEEQRAPAEDIGMKSVLQGLFDKEVTSALKKLLDTPMKSNQYLLD